MLASNSTVVQSQEPGLTNDSDEKSASVKANAQPGPSWQNSKHEVSFHDVVSDADTVQEICGVNFHSDISDSEITNVTGNQLLRCPECKEKLPSAISPQLASTLGGYCKTCKWIGPGTTAVFRMGLDICNLTRKEKSKDNCLERAVQYR